MGCEPVFLRVFLGVFIGFAYIPNIARFVVFFVAAPPRGSRKGYYNSTTARVCFCRCGRFLLLRSVFPSILKVPSFVSDTTDLRIYTFFFFLFFRFVSFVFGTKMRQSWVGRATHPLYG